MLDKKGEGNSDLCNFSSFLRVSPSFIDGKAVEISDLSLMQFEYSQEITKTIKEKRDRTAQLQDRLIFMVVDTIDIKQKETD